MRRRDILSNRPRGVIECVGPVGKRLPYCLVCMGVWPGQFAQDTPPPGGEAR